MATPQYLVDPEQIFNDNEAQNLDINPNAFDCAEVTFELEMFTSGMRSVWPPWLKLQFKKYLLLLEELCQYRNSVKTYTNNPEDEEKARQAIGMLTDRSGMIYHFGKRFSIGGPGAHPDDINGVIRLAGLHLRSEGVPEDMHANLIWASQRYQRTLIRQMYHTTVRSDWKTWRLVASTTGSAPTRSLLRGIPHKKEHYAALLEDGGIPRKLAEIAKAKAKANPVLVFATLLGYDSNGPLVARIKEWMTKEYTGQFTGLSKENLHAAGLAILLEGGYEEARTFTSIVEIFKMNEGQGILASQWQFYTTPKQCMGWPEHWMRCRLIRFKPGSRT